MRESCSCAYIKSLTSRQNIVHNIILLTYGDRTGSDVTKRKLFFYMYIDTDVVEAQKIINKVCDNRNRFSLYPYYLEGEGEERGCLFKECYFFFEILAKRLGA